MKWIAVEDALPEVRDKAYQVLCICKKQYDEGSNYVGLGRLM